MPEKNTRSPQPAPPHDLILEGRARLTVTGVQKVLHCNADSAAIETGRGILHLAGAQLSMAALDLEAGEAKFTGRIDALEYTASARRAAFCTACCDDPGPAALSHCAGADRLHGVGRVHRCGAGRVPGQGPGGVGARFSMGGHGADPAAELCGGAEPGGRAALVYGSSWLCRSRRCGLCSGRAAARGREGFAAVGAPACRTAAYPAAKCPQITPQRKKNRKKAQKELAKPAPDDV